MAPPFYKKRKSGEFQKKRPDSGPNTISAPPSKAVPVQFDDDVPDFPRGGGSRLSKGESDEIRAEVDAEFDDAEVRDTRRKKKSKVSRGGRRTNEDDLGSLFGEGVTGKMPRFANKITFKNISPGMKLWGVVTEVNEKDLAVSLPVGLRRLVRASEAVEYTLLDTQKMAQRVVHGLVLDQVESRASVPPLEVTLDDVEDDVSDAVDLKKSDAVCGALDEKNKRQAKKKVKEERELEIRAAEQRLLEKDAPRTTDEYEKVVRSSPNSSFVWIKYMQFMLSMADVEGARSIAERALKTINITCETEKLNVWVAYLNLENQYGDPREEAVQSLFQRALQYCDPFKLHLELLGLFERTNQQKLVDELLDKMTKKFKQSCEVWLKRVQWIIKHNPVEVHNMIKRALLSLPLHEHIKFISQAAILEYKMGVPDRGRSIFEKMLREYPKRTDLWSVYLDQEIRLGDVDVIRSLFERATSLSLTAKRMKSLFCKYLNYEKSHGDEERIRYVKDKARECLQPVI